MAVLVLGWILFTGLALLGSFTGLNGILDTGQQVVLGGAGLASLGFGALVFVFTRLYVKTSANESFYRTGQGEPKVVIDGGTLYVPMVHELTRVLLETMKFEVTRQGTEALICKDYLRVDVSAEFYIRVNKTVEGVKRAATTLGKNASDPAEIKSILFEKLVSALRTVSATMDLNELHQNREDFARLVMEAVTKDIQPNGFILETVTISQLDQTDVSNLKEDNVFDAQGIRKAAEITNLQKVARNQIERASELQITEENTKNRELILEQEKKKALAEEAQRAIVEMERAKKSREVAEFKIQQEEEIEKRNVQKVQEIEAAEIRKQKLLLEEEKARESTALEMQRALIEKEGERESAEVLKQKLLIEKAAEREAAEVAKQRAIEVALRQQEAAVALAEKDRAEAQAAQRLAEAQEREAAEKVRTAAELEIARREKAKALLKAEQDGERLLIEMQKNADAEAYTKLKESEAEKIAAENQAAARIRLAEAALEAQKREAEGRRAVEMVPVDVDRERVEISKAEQFIPVEVDAKRVKVEEERVAVLREELSAKDQFQKAAIELELAKEKIAAQRAVGEAMAESYGRFMERGNFQVFGSPETLAKMTEKFSTGLGINQLLAGFKESNPLLGGLVDTGLEAATSGLEAFQVHSQGLVEVAKSGLEDLKKAGTPSSGEPRVPEVPEDLASEEVASGS